MLIGANEPLAPARNFRPVLAAKPNPIFTSSVLLIAAVSCGVDGAAHGLFRGRKEIKPSAVANRALASKFAILAVLDIIRVGVFHDEPPFVPTMILL